MPPQQGYRLPDLVDNVLDFLTHFSSLIGWLAARRPKRRGT
jgi:hypothetical protein